MFESRVSTKVCNSSSVFVGLKNIFFFFLFLCLSKYNLHIEPTFQRRQRQISWVWDHVTRCLAHGNFSQLHTSDETDVSPPALVNAYAHAHMNGDHPENEERPTNQLVTNVPHRHKEKIEMPLKTKQSAWMSLVCYTFIWFFAFSICTKKTNNPIFRTDLVLLPVTGWRINMFGWNLESLYAMDLRADVHPIENELTIDLCTDYWQPKNRKRK